MEVKLRVWETEDSPDAQPQGLIRSVHCGLVRLTIADSVTWTRNGLYLVLSRQSPRRTRSAQSPNGLHRRLCECHQCLSQWVGVPHPVTGFKMMLRMSVSWLRRQVTTALNRAAQASNRNCLY